MTDLVSVVSPTMDGSGILILHIFLCYENISILSCHHTCMLSVDSTQLPCIILEKERI